jgi:hypothetical protein
MSPKTARSVTRLGIASTITASGSGASTHDAQEGSRNVALSETGTIVGGVATGISEANAIASAIVGSTIRDTSVAGAEAIHASLVGGRGTVSTAAGSGSRYAATSKRGIRPSG